MKIASISLLFILLFKASFANTEDKIDSLIQTVIKQNTADIQETELLGQWTKGGGFFNQNLTFRKDNKLTSSNLLCVVNERTKGRWIVQESGIIRLQVNNQITQIYVSKIDAQIYLWTEEELKQIKALTNDYLKMQQLQTGEEIAAFIRKGLIAITYKKTAS